MDLARTTVARNCPVRSIVGRGDDNGRAWPRTADVISVVGKSERFKRDDPREINFLRSLQCLNSV